MILPQFGSSPAIAVLTNGEFATEKAIFFASISFLHLATFIFIGASQGACHAGAGGASPEMDNNNDLFVKRCKITLQVYINGIDNLLVFT